MMALRAQDGDGWECNDRRRDDAMTPRQRLIQHFAGTYPEVRKLRWREPVKHFNCPNATGCDFRIRHESSWSPAFGDEESRVMLVAEAPSSKGGHGVGAYTGGVYRQWEAAFDPALVSLREFTREYFGCVPHFTDLVKCGVARQTPGAKKVLTRRIKLCFEHLLREEIAILSPEVIVCVGERAFTELSAFQRAGNISSSIQLRNLLHYGRQASLPITPEEKLNIVWRLQLGDPLTARISDLEYIRKSRRG